MKTPVEAKNLWKLLDKYKYVLLVILAGVILLLWPTGERKEPAADGPGSAQAEFDLAALEEKLSRTLSQVEGAGRVTVALTVRSGTEQVPLTDRASASSTDRGTSAEEKTVVVNTGSGQEVAVRVTRCPEFQGAVVVCPGGGDAQVQLLLTQAVSALTGLGSDRITVCRGNG